MRKKFITLLTATALGLGVLAGCGSGSGTGDTSAQTDTSKSVEITNVSYDPTREFYEAYNALFNDYWYEIRGKHVEIIQSHGGSGGNNDDGFFFHQSIHSLYTTCTDCA